jgi:transglutaminase-like putative cysteine protease
MTPGRERAPAGRRAVDAFFEFSLLGLVTSGYLAVVGSGYLDLPTTLLTAAGLLLRALLVLGLVRLPLTDRGVAAATAAYIAFYPADYFFLSKEFLPATVHLVFFVGVVKILTAKTNRDYFFVKIIAFLELLAASVLSSKLNFFLFLALFLLFGVATFASSEIRRSAGRGAVVARGGMRRFGWRLAALTLVAAAGILAMTASLFFVLPRTARAAFQHLVPERYHLPGFSDQVVLGEIGQIKRRATPVLRARIYGRDHEMPLKWRGAALTQFDGRRWYNPPETGQLLKVSHSVLRLADDRQRWRSGERINYEVQIKDVGVDALLFAGIPEFITIPVPSIIRTRTDSFRLYYGATEGLRYGAYSYLEGPDGTDTGPAAPPLEEQDRNELLLLPQIDPRIIRLARQVTAGRETDRERAAAIEAYLKRNYAYSLELPAREPADPLADFLFVRRQGHCEYFASAMAVMLRVVWVPSRVVTGFQSGTFNPVTRWHVIRASDAHSWVEAFLPGAGWRTYDPTPPDPSPAAPPLLTRLGLYLDAAETFWQEWVLNYNLDRQMLLAYRMEESGRRLSLWRMDGAATWARRARRVAGAWLTAYGGWLAAALGLAAVAALAAPPLARWLRLRRRVSRVRRGQATAADATLLYERLLRLLRARGFEKAAGLTPLEFLRTLPPSPIAPLAGEFTVAYNELRFGGRREAAARLTRLLEQLERA